MKLKDIYIDKETGKPKIFGKIKLKLFGSSADNLKKPEIILTKKEAEERGLDLKKNPKGDYTKIDGIRVPINIEE